MPNKNYFLRVCKKEIKKCTECDYSANNNLAVIPHYKMTHKCDSKPGNKKIRCDNYSKFLKRRLDLLNHKCK